MAPHGGMPRRLDPQMHTTARAATRPTVGGRRERKATSSRHASGPACRRAGAARAPPAGPWTRAAAGAAAAAAAVAPARVAAAAGASVGIVSESRCGSQRRNAGAVAQLGGRAGSKPPCSCQW
eukprot:350834-Chlamydomonas_euryale.AAC.1